MEMGRFPNIYYHSLSFEHLRRSSDYFALPPVESICLIGPSSYQYVRQDDHLWSRLHQGRLTSGYIAAALGFYEPLAAKRLKINKSKVDHGRLLAVYRHLLDSTVYDPPKNPHITESSAELHNAHITYAFNSSSATLQDEDSEPRLSSSSGDDEEDTPQKKKKKGKMKKGSRRTKFNNSLNSTESSSLLLIPEEELKLKKARALSSQGVNAIRCAWGKVQEASALKILAQAFPESTVREIGLVVFDKNKQENIDLLNEWGVDDPESISELAASPDSVISHRGSSLPDLLTEACRISISGGEEEQEEFSSIAASSKDLLEDMNAPPYPSELPLPPETRLANLSLAENDDDNNNKTKSTLEVVEIKNSCPFDQAGSKYFLNGRGPRGQIDILWIPQLQLQMLCTGAESTLLVCRSASRGIYIFRVRADRELQRAMVLTLQRLQTEFVKKKRPPPKDAFYNTPDHQMLINRVLKTQAELIGEVSGEVAAEILKGTDQRFFLD